MHSILIIEADQQTLTARGDELLADGYEVLDAATDHQARVLLARGQVEAAILGNLETAAHPLGLLRDLRAGEIPGADNRLPVLTVGADRDHQAVRHYQAGADIALPSAASPLLVSAGLTALAHRQAEHRRRILRTGNLTVDCDARTTTVDGKPVPLTRLQFDLLQALARHPHMTLTRQHLSNTLWGDDFGRARTLDAHAARMRTKLDAAGIQPPIQPVRGIGYRLGG
jgi:two-component system, OmpR family, alkaline phosphatase synthesis response regulator PhoP